MPEDKGFEQLGDLFKIKQVAVKSGNLKKPPAYQWQDFALFVINELNIPNFKRSATFKVCRDCRKPFVERCLNETKELCKSGEKWKYFFKLVTLKENSPSDIQPQKGTHKTVPAVRTLFRPESPKE